MLALYPSHSRWHCEGAIGSVYEIALAGNWQSQRDSGDWLKLERSFADGHTDVWWALEGEAGPYGLEKERRLVIVTSDPATLPELSTWYLCTNLPAPGTGLANTSTIEAADLGEIVRLNGLRVWVEQSYRQVKQHLGWAQYQIRSDLAIRRHWQLVCLAFSFCWWAAAQTKDVELPAELSIGSESSRAQRTQAQPKKKAFVSPGLRRSGKFALTWNLILCSHVTGKAIAAGPHLRLSRCFLISSFRAKVSTCMLESTDY